MLLFIFLLSQRRLFIFIPPLYINVFNNCVECIHVFPCLLRLRKIVTVNITSIYCRNKISVGSCLLLLLCLWFVVVVDDDDFNGAGGWGGGNGGHKCVPAVSFPYKSQNECIRLVYRTIDSIADWDFSLFYFV